MKLNNIKKAKELIQSRDFLLELKEILVCKGKVSQINSAFIAKEYEEVFYKNILNLIDSEVKVLEKKLEEI